MINKIVVTIGGRDYTMVAAENEDYVRRCAELVNQQLQEVMGDGRLSQADRQPIPAYMSCGGQSGSSMSGPVRGERGDRQRSRRSQAGQDPAAA